VGGEGEGIGIQTICTKEGGRGGGRGCRGRARKGGGGGEGGGAETERRGGAGGEKNWRHKGGSAEDWWSGGGGPLPRGSGCNGKESDAGSSISKRRRVGKIRQEKKKLLD